MRSYIFVTFAFLGFAFYELSGGADYEPVENSIQARASDRIQDKLDQPEEVIVASSGAAEPLTNVETVTRAASTLNDLNVKQDAQEDRFQITLASVEPSEPSIPKIKVDTAKAETVPDASAIDAAVEAAVTESQIQTETQTEEAATQEVFSLETYVAEQDTQNQTFGASSTPGDIREVSGNMVNMRAGPGTDFQRVGALSKGMEVIVLDEPGNGWLMLEVVETGETGWMADWLVTASN